MRVCLLFLLINHKFAQVSEFQLYKSSVLQLFVVPLQPLCPPKGEIGAGTGACSYRLLTL